MFPIEHFILQVGPCKKIAEEDITIWSNNLGEFCIAYSLLGDSLAHYPSYKR